MGTERLYSSAEFSTQLKKTAKLEAVPTLKPEARNFLKSLNTINQDDLSYRLKETKCTRLNILYFEKSYRPL